MIVPEDKSNRREAMEFVLQFVRDLPKPECEIRQKQLKVI